MTKLRAITFLDNTDTERKFQWNGDSPQVCAQSYLHAVAEGDIAGHAQWSKLGFSGSVVASTTSDLWGSGGIYAFPSAEMQMEVVSTDNTDDIASVIKGDATGDTVESDNDGTTTTLEDDDVDFTAATAVAAGDCVLLDPHGTTPEWGYVTGVAAHTLTIAGGFSSGGSGASRKYAVVDYSATAGAHVVRASYLDGDYEPKVELRILNGTTPVDTVNTDLFRINGFKVIAAGTKSKPSGALAIRETDGSPNYSYILAGYNRARCSAYTIPNGKTLYLVSATLAYGYSTNQTHYARLYVSANRETDTQFLTDGIFYAQVEIVCANTSQWIELDSPLKFPEKTDIKASVLATYAGVAFMSMRGWME